MKKIITLMLALSLTACASTPTTQAAKEAEAHRLHCEWHKTSMRPVAC